MTATLPTRTATPAVDAGAALERIWDATLRGARSYLERNVGIEVVPDLIGPDARLEVELDAELDELLAHLGGIVQAAAREVVARCRAELLAFDRDPDTLRNIAIGRIARDDVRTGEDVAIVSTVGPCLIVRADAAELLLPVAGATASATVRDHGSVIVVHMTRVVQFILGHDREYPR